MAILYELTASYSDAPDNFILITINLKENNDQITLNIVEIY